MITRRKFLASCIAAAVAPELRLASIWDGPLDQFEWYGDREVTASGMSILMQNGPTIGDVMRCENQRIMRQIVAIRERQYRQLETGEGLIEVSA